MYSALETSGMLSFIGLGLYDEHSITKRGEQRLADADVAFLEGYTSVLTGTSVARLEAVHDRSIEVVGRKIVEQAPDRILDQAATSHVAFLTGGDPMIATTHIDLRLRANARDISTSIVHGTTAASAAAGLSGLQQYRFGRAATVPFPQSSGVDGVPPSVFDAIAENTSRGLHTLLFLDLHLEDIDYQSVELAEHCLTASQGAALLADELPDRLAVAIARAGSDQPQVVAKRMTALADTNLGPPLHLLVLPGDLHDMEREALEQFAGADPSLFDRQ